MRDPWVRQVWDDQDEVLETLVLVHGDDALEGRLFHQLVDLLVEGMFVELREQYLGGEIERSMYLTKLGRLVEQCRTAGLLPLPGNLA